MAIAKGNKPAELYHVRELNALVRMRTAEPEEDLSIIKKSIAAVMCLFLWAGFSVADEARRPEFATLAEQLEAYSARFEIEIKGIEKALDAPAVSGRIDNKRHIKRLLKDFNYVLIHEEGGDVEGVIVLERKMPTPDRIVLETEKVGNRHMIPVFLTGNNGARVEVRLLVDTGADYLVLPESMMAGLGVAPEGLESRKMQTANGLAEAKVGRLPALEIGGDVIENIQAAFIADDLLGEAKILGMQVLSRYRMTIDDEQQQITLIKIK
ncbi:MAG: retropepsin-like aspartic protease [Pseudomonadota bacterium]